MQSMENVNDAIFGRNVPRDAQVHSNRNVDSSEECLACIQGFPNKQEFDEHRKFHEKLTAISSETVVHHKNTELNSSHSKNLQPKKSSLHHFDPEILVDDPFSDHKDHEAPTKKIKTEAEQSNLTAVQQNPLDILKSENLFQPAQCFQTYVKDEITLYENDQVLTRTTNAPNTSLDDFHHSAKANAPFNMFAETVSCSFQRNSNFLTQSQQHGDLNWSQDHTYSIPIKLYPDRNGEVVEHQKDEHDQCIETSMKQDWQHESHVDISLSENAGCWEDISNQPINAAKSSLEKVKTDTIVNDLPGNFIHNSKIITNQGSLKESAHVLPYAHQQAGRSPHNQAEFTDKDFQNICRNSEIAPVISDITSSNLPTYTSNNLPIFMSSNLPKSRNLPTFTTSNLPTCETCGRMFLRYGDLKQHLEKQPHGNGCWKVCHVCGKKCKEAKRYKEHMLIHFGEKKHVCLVCGRGFLRPSDLNKHLLIHTGVKNHVCQVCNRAFARSSSLNSHMKIHQEGRAKYQCTVCNRTYHYDSSFKEHMLKHQNPSSEKPSVACFFCGMELSSKNHLRRHMRKFHSREISPSNLFKPLKYEGININVVHVQNKCFCNICRAVCQNFDKLDNHMRVVHGQSKTILCNVCRKAFSNDLHLMVHKLRHNDTKETNILCVTCGESILEQGHIKKHIITHHKDRLRACQNCNKLFYNQADLIRHKLTHRKTAPTACKFCKRSFASLGRLKFHLQKRKTKRYTCSECIHHFCKFGKRKEHILKHKEEKRQTCKVCKKVCKNQLVLKAHRIKHKLKKKEEKNTTVKKKKRKRSTPKEKVFMCEICGQGYAKSFPFKAHLRKHAGIREFKCEICDKSFVERRNLLNHMLIHGERKFECEICHRKFSFESNLKRHMNVHTGLKPFSCHICDAKFTRREVLKRHIKYHSEPFDPKRRGYRRGHQEGIEYRVFHEAQDNGLSQVRKFQCLTCKKEFHNIVCVKNHILIHGEKKFECDICNMKFHCGSNLRRHERIHTNKDAFKCAICKKGFARKDQLKVHMQTRHKK